jgi:hypothetical protein
MSSDEAILKHCYRLGKGLFSEPIKTSALSFFSRPSYQKLGNLGQPSGTPEKA